jgi:hypothetical protein
MWQKLSNKAEKVVTTTKNNVKNAFKRSKKAPAAVSALPKVPALEEPHQEQPLVNPSPVPLSIARSKSCPNVIITMPASSRLVRVRSAPAALTGLALAACHVEPSPASEASFHTANSAANNKMYLNDFNNSRPASSTSTNYYSAASATPAPSSSSRAASPVDDNNDMPWTIPVGNIVCEGSETSCKGLFRMTAAEKLDEEYERFLLDAVNITKPARLYQMPAYIDSTSLPQLAPGQAFAPIYDVANNNASMPRPASPEVGCFSAFTALFAALTTPRSQSASAPKVPLTQRMLKKLTKAAKIAKTGATATRRSLSDAWGSATNSVTNSFRSLGSTVGGGMDSAAAGLRRASSSMGEALEGAGTSFKQRVNSAGSAVGDVFESTATGIKRGLSTAGSSVGSALESTTSSIKRGVSAASTSLGEALDEAKVASDQAVNRLAIKLTLGLTLVNEKIKATSRVFQFGSSKKETAQGGVSYGSEVVVGRFGQQWGIVVSPGLPAPTAA